MDSSCVVEWISRQVIQLTSSGQYNGEVVGLLHFEQTLTIMNSSLTRAVRASVVEINGYANNKLATTRKHQIRELTFNDGSDF